MLMRSERQGSDDVLIVRRGEGVEGAGGVLLLIIFVAWRVLAQVLSAGGRVILAVGHARMTIDLTPAGHVTRAGRRRRGARGRRGGLAVLHRSRGEFEPVLRQIAV